MKGSNIGLGRILLVEENMCDQSASHLYLSLSHNPLIAIMDNDIFANNSCCVELVNMWMEKGLGHDLQGIARELVGRRGSFGLGLGLREFHLCGRKGKFEKKNILKY